MFYRQREEVVITIIVIAITMFIAIVITFVVAIVITIAITIVITIVIIIHLNASHVFIHMLRSSELR